MFAIPLFLGDFHQSSPNHIEHYIANIISLNGQFHYTRTFTEYLLDS